MGAWSRVIAALYDPLTRGAEGRGLAAARRSLLADVDGDVLELGAGTGWNVEHYPPGARVVFTEPDPHMARRLRERAGSARVVVAPAEKLPFPDASFDAVISTLVLCSVSDVAATLREVRRVLRPGGRLLFLEHVRGAPGSSLERWQDRLELPWRVLAGGCHCNRDLLAALDAASLTPARVERHEWPWMPALVRPVLIGVAKEPETPAR